MVGRVSVVGGVTVMCRIIAIGRVRMMVEGLTGVVEVNVVDGVTIEDWELGRAFRVVGKASAVGGVILTQCRCLWGDPER